MKSQIGISLPQGVRDILPEEARTIGRVEEVITATFRGYGFERIITPLLEYVDVLSLGMGHDLKDRVLKFIDPTTGKVVAIRPDITPQIARVVATRMRDSRLPLKLFYNESVLRYGAPSGSGCREVLQIGAEQITEKRSPAADAEMIVMAVEAMQALGIRDFKLDIGDVGFVRAILGSLDIDEESRRLVREAIAKKDGSGLDALLTDMKDRISPAQRDMLLALTTFYGEEEVIEKAGAFVKAEEAVEALDYIKKVVELVAQKGLKEHITIDLGEVRGFDYYTGIIFEGFASGVGKPILSGGRYDTLLGRYGLELASTGFAFDVENVVSAIGIDRA